MNAQTSRKIIVAGGMAVAVGIGITIFALRSHPVASAAQTSQPPAPTTQIPATDPAPPPLTADADANATPIAQTAATAVDQIPAVAPTPVAETAAVPEAATNNDSVGTKSTDTDTPSRRHHLAAVDTKAVTTDPLVTRAAPAADTSEKPSPETIANSARGINADELTPPPAASSSPTDDQKAGTTTEFATSDSQSATDVKPEIVGDSPGKDANSGGSTTVPQ
jgi:hypothetical protein